LLRPAIAVNNEQSPVVARLPGGCCSSVQVRALLHNPAAHAAGLCE